MFAGALNEVAGFASASPRICDFALDCTDSSDTTLKCCDGLKTDARLSISRCGYNDNSPPTDCKDGQKYSYTRKSSPRQDPFMSYTTTRTGKPRKLMYFVEEKCTRCHIVVPYDTYDSTCAPIPYEFHASSSCLPKMWVSSYLALWYCHTIPLTNSVLSHQGHLPAICRPSHRQNKLSDDAMSEDRRCPTLAPSIPNDVPCFSLDTCPTDPVANTHRSVANPCFSLMSYISMTWDTLH